MLDGVGVLRAVRLHLWKAPEMAVRLLVQLAQGLQYDLIGDRYIADLLDESVRLEELYLVRDCVKSIAKESNEMGASVTHYE